MHTSVTIHPDGLAAKYNAKSGDTAVEPKAREAAMLLVVADGHIIDEDPEQALKAATNALTLCKELGDLQGIADSARILVQSHNFENRYEESMKVVEEEMTRFKKTNDREGTAKMLLSSAEINGSRRGPDKFALKRLDEALEAGTGALTIFRDLGDKKMEGLALLELGNINSQLRSMKKEGKKDALLLAEEAKEIFQSIGEKRLTAAALAQIAGLRVELGEYMIGFEAATEALDTIQELGLRKMEAYHLQNMASWHLEEGEAKKAVPLAEEALEIYREANGMHSREASAVGTLFEALITIAEQKNEEGTQKFRAAESVAEEALWRYEAAKFGDGVAGCLDLLVRVSTAKGELDEALQFAKRAQTAYAEVGDKFSESRMLRMISQIQLHKDLFKKALEAAQESVEVLKPIAHPGHIAEALASVAVAQHKRGNYKAAMARLTEGQALMRECGDAQGEATALASLAKLHMAHGEYKAALRTAGEAREFYEEMDDDEGLASVLFMIAKTQFMNLVSGNKRSQPGSKSWNEGMERAQRAAKESVSLAKEVGNQHTRAAAVFVLAQVAFAQEKYSECIEHSNEAVMTCRASGDLDNEAVALMLSADCYHELNMMDDARAAAQESLDITRYMGDTSGQQEASELLAKIEPKPDQLTMQKAMEMLQLQGQQPQQVQAAGGTIPFVPKGMQQQQQQPSEAAAIQRVAGQVLDTSGGLSREIVGDKIREIVASLVGDEDDLENDLPLMTAGLTSNSAVLLVDAIKEEIPGVKVSPTLVFDYPSINDIAAHLTGK